jgi:hypothetical protein
LFRLDHALSPKALFGSSTVGIRPLQLWDVLLKPLGWSSEEKGFFDANPVNLWQLKQRASFDA